MSNIESLSAFKRSLLDGFQESVKQLGGKSFLGGSYRFGYALPNSDLDIFVYLPNWENRYNSHLYNSLFSGFALVTDEPYYPGTYQYELKTTTMVRLMHVNVISGIDKYRKLEDEHDGLANKLAARPQDVNNILQLRKAGVINCKGAILYRYLLAN